MKISRACWKHLTTSSALKPRFPHPMDGNAILLHPSVAAFSRQICMESANLCNNYPRFRRVIEHTVIHIESWRRDLRESRGKRDLRESRGRRDLRECRGRKDLRESHRGGGT